MPNLYFLKYFELRFSIWYDTSSRSMFLNRNDFEILRIAVELVYCHIGESIYLCDYFFTVAYICYVIEKL